MCDDLVSSTTTHTQDSASLEDFLYPQLRSSYNFAYHTLAPVTHTHTSSLRHCELVHSTFVPKHVREHILQHCDQCTLVSTRLFGVHVRIFMSRSDTSTSSPTCSPLHTTQAQRVIWILHTLLSLSRSCPPTVRSLDIYLCLTDFKKRFPRQPSRQTVLGPVHCNSAVTYQCAEHGKYWCTARKNGVRC